jgi:RNA polymerase sigma-70 factor (ECF subfamily)
VAPERQLDTARLGDHTDRLYRAAWALCGNRHDAEDLVQETYVRVLAKPRFLRSEDDIGYLLRVLRNTFLTKWATAARRPASVPLGGGEGEVEVEDRRSSAEPQRALEVGEVFGATAALSDEYRDVLVAVDVVGLSYKEAAGFLRIKEGTVMSRLFRARRELARRLGE